MQGQLDAYFLKARGATESQRDQDACSALAAESVALLMHLYGVKSREGAPAALKQSPAAGSNGKQKGKKAREARPGVKPAGAAIRKAGDAHRKAVVPVTAEKQKERKMKGQKPQKQKQGS